MYSLFADLHSWQTKATLEWDFEICCQGYEEKKQAEDTNTVNVEGVLGP